MHHEYLVRWEVEVSAESPADAVELAVGMLPVVGNDTTATCFAVQRVDPSWSKHVSPALTRPVMIDIAEE